MATGKISEPERGQKVRRSADVVSLIRFEESKKEHPLFHDPYSFIFTSAEGEEMLEQSLRRWPFFAEYILVRDRFFDDHLREFCRENDCRQIVLLGAGNDMRAARLPFFSGKVFEVDLPDQTTLKKAILQKELGRLPDQAVYLEANVIEDDVVGKLASAGFALNEKSAFIIEGLIYYLRSEGVDCLFDKLVQIPKVGNLFLIDHISEDFSQKSLNPAGRGKTPYPEDLPAYLAGKGFTIRETALLGDLTNRYCGKGYPERWWVVAAVK